MPKPGMHSEIIERLRETLTPDKDGKILMPKGSQDFAASLLRSFDRYGKLSPAQEKWVPTLIERAEAAEGTLGTMTPKKADYPTISIGTPTGIFLLFENARKNAIEIPIIQFQVGTRKIRLTQMTADRPINITEKIGENKTWFGAFDRVGTLKYSDHMFPELIEVLKQACVNSSGLFSQLGNRQKWCCFCATRLRSQDSTYYGYGPICAAKWGLEWGEAKSRMLAEAIPNLAEMAKGLENL